MEKNQEEDRWVVNETADNGLVCVQSRDGQYSLGLAWAQAHKIGMRSTIPCVHSEPVYPALEPGQKNEAKGSLYFSDEGLEAIHERFQVDIKDKKLYVKIID